MCVRVLLLPVGFCEPVLRCLPLPEPPPWAAYLGCRVVFFGCVWRWWLGGPCGWCLAAACQCVFGCGFWRLFSGVVVPVVGFGSFRLRARFGPHSRLLGAAVPCRFARFLRGSAAFPLWLRILPGLQLGFFVSVFAWAADHFVCVPCFRCRASLARFSSASLCGARALRFCAVCLVSVLCLLAWLLRCVFPVFLVAWWSSLGCPVWCAVGGGACRWSRPCLAGCALAPLAAPRPSSFPGFRTLLRLARRSCIVPRSVLVCWVGGRRSGRYFSFSAVPPLASLARLAPFPVSVFRGVVRLASRSAFPPPRPVCFWASLALPLLLLGSRPPPCGFFVRGCCGPDHPVRGGLWAAVLALWFLPLLVYGLVLALLCFERVCFFWRLVVLRLAAV